MERTEAAKPGRTARESFSAALLALITCQVGLHACTQGVRMAAPLQALGAGQGEWSVGVLLALFAVFPALLAVAAGRMADRHGYHRPVHLAGTLSLLGALAAAVSGHYLVLCLAAAMCGAGSGFGMVAIQRTGGRLAHDRTERMRIFSWIALAPAVAGLIGPLLAGTLIDALGFRAAFAALAVLPAATLVVAQAVPRETGRVADAAAARPRPAWELLRDTRFRRLLFINWLVSASWDVFGFALPIVGHAHGLSASAIGGVLAAYAMASMGVRLLIPLLAHRLSRRLMMVGALSAVAFVYAAFPLLQGAWAMGVAAAVLGLALGTIQPAILASVHDIAPPERQGEAMAVRSMSVHLSMALTPLLFGVAGSAIGAATLFWLMAAALGAGGWQARAMGSADESTRGENR
ncbi:MFS transporter [Azohydromonas lata]|jgi:MFS family permease|uniref:MFS transporter n=1 Tax=Azohydromonas lata TaxID=45677 RepID=UPI00082A7751|nr:MFS transporter [Azohydromonas lata]